MTSAISSRISAVAPLWAVEGGRVTISGSGFSVDPALPRVRIGNTQARLATASPSSLTAVVPGGLEGGRMPIRIDEAPGETAYVEIGAPLATGLHQVDSPAFDTHGNLFVTFSGSRGQQSPVAIYVVRHDGTREPFVSDLANPTSLAFDRHGRLHVSSRFDGSVHRVDPDGTVTSVAADLGVACGIAFGPDEGLYVGDRSGTILRVSEGRATEFATIPPSVAAFHLAFGPDGWLYVTAPTLGVRDPVYRISPSGNVETFHEGFGRPQGLAFDEQGHLYVVDALAGSGGVYRLRADRPGEAEQVVAGGSLIGLAFDPRGGLVLASSDTVYKLDVDVRGLLPPGIA
ncbi:MAG TPA: SMP-30/gluconolactonase/LRE family protein [Vicinamibacterales bacterium]